MILVLLGTQDKSFERLLKYVDESINNGTIKEDVIAQVGYTKYESKNIKMFDLIKREEMNDLVNKASLIITHGGVGAITDAIKAHKKVIAVARLKKYNEHTNDHQLQIVKEFTDMGYIMSLNENEKLDDVIRASLKFKPKEYAKNNKIIEMIEEFIDGNEEDKCEKRRNINKC